MKAFSFFLRSILFYIFLFAFYRLLFLLFYALPAEEIGFSDILLSFIYGFRLDLSVAAYIHILPLILWLSSFGSIGKHFEKVTRYYHSVVIVLLTVESISNLVIYKYWNTLLNWRALGYITEPGEMLASITFLQLLIILVLIIVAVVASLKLFFKKFYKREEVVAPGFFSRTGLGILFAFLLLTAMRGGWQLMPVNESVAYYSSSQVLNDAATNSIWHLGHSAAVAASDKNPFIVMSNEKANAIVDSLYFTPVDSSPHVLSQLRPNIVFIILESFSSDLLGSLGAQIVAAPFLDSIASQGILFTNIYSSGFRTDQGLTSLLSGFPATPLFSVIRYPEKTAALSSLCSILKTGGYSTSFYYGGAGNFRNMKSYCFNMGFGKFTDKEDFDSDLPHNKWGVHDEYVLMRHARETNGFRQPFFTAVMTLSNHEPFDVPMETKFPGKNNVEMFRNSAYYTDLSLKKYFQFAESQSWFKNTLFIFIADHGHELPLHRAGAGPESHRIPFILYGNVIRQEFRGTKVSVTGNHHDLPATLLKQLGFDSKKFTWSKDLLNPSSKSFAYYEQEDGFGWIENDGWIYYSSLQQKTILQSDSLKNRKELMDNGSAFLQKLYDEFLRF